MSRTYHRMEGSGSGGVYASLDRFSLDDGNQAKNDIDMLALGVLRRDVFMGGSRELGVTVTADGDYDLIEWRPITTDNTNTQFTGFTDSNGATHVAQVRFLIRVSDLGISPAPTATPKMRYGAAFSDIAVAGTGTVATISGEAACSTTTVDYSGSNQYQTISITVPTGVKLWKPQVTIAGTGGVPLTFWALALFDEYIQST